MLAIQLWWQASRLHLFFLKQPTRLLLQLARLIQSRENFRIADICPFTSELERFHFFTGMSKVADSIGQFVFAAWGRFQFRGEIENAWPKRVKAGVIPRARRFAWFWFFAKIEQIHLVIEKHRAALTNVFAARDCQNASTSSGSSTRRL